MQYSTLIFIMEHTLYKLFITDTTTDWEEIFNNTFCIII